MSVSVVLVYMLNIDEEIIKFDSQSPDKDYNKIIHDF